MVRARSWLDVAAVLLTVLAGHGAGLHTSPSAAELEEITASPFDAASLTATEGRSDGVGATDSFPMLSGELERQSGTDLEPKHEVHTDGNVNDEDVEFSSPTASTYISSITSQVQKKTSVSVITHRIPNHELNTSEIYTQTPSEIYQTSSSSSFQITFQGSTQMSSQTSTHTSSQPSAQVSSQTILQVSPHIHSPTSQNSPSISHSTTQTSSLLLSQPFSETSPQTSSQSSPQMSLQTSSQTTLQMLDQMSSQTTTETFAQRTLLTSPKSVWDGKSGTTISQAWMNKATASEFYQLDNTTEHYKSQDGISLNNQSVMQYTDATQQSLDTVSQGTPNSTLPLALSDDIILTTETVQYSTIPGDGVFHSESKVTVSSVSHEVSTEGSLSNTSLLVNENTITSKGNMGSTTESPAEFLYTHGSTEEDTDKETKGHLASTIEPSVIMTAMDESLSEVLPSQLPFTINTEKSGETTVVLSRNHWTGTQMSESSKDPRVQSTASSTTFIPPNVQSTTGWPQVLLTTHTTQKTPLTRSSTSQKPLSIQPTAIFTQKSLETSTITDHMETSTAMLGSTTGYKQTPKTAYGNTASVRTTMAQTTKGLKEKVTMDVERSTAFQSTKAAETPVSRNTCDKNVCQNGGKCIQETGKGHRCVCLSAWKGQNCTEDVDECVSEPCPVDSQCVNTQGSFSCECRLGYHLENGRTCTYAKTFLGTFSIVNFSNFHLHEIQREILQLLNSSLSGIKGYSRSKFDKIDEMHISVVNMFFMRAEVTRADVLDSIQMYLRNCSQAISHCRLVARLKLSYTDKSLCAVQKPPCDPKRTECADISGITFCQCQSGYFKQHTDDRSCLGCGDGFKLENGTCIPCLFGFGGFNCEHAYKLIAVVVSPAAGVLLLILLIALIVTCCRKNKNDINKMIFKSADFQMSSYAEFPKSNCVSMEWGRETLELQENGSTKNLLQMTDIYYPAALRNLEHERSGLYHFSGLPGSRHSCIYPAQWNPSFVSDDTRRRDYF